MSEQNCALTIRKCGDSPKYNYYQMCNHTTVTELILGNPGVNPYNLQIGMKLFICPGEGYVPPQNPGGGNMGGGTGKRWKWKEREE
ncbi:MAG: hypothetical protein ACLRP8_08380 [Roseburia intestinalis]